MGTALGGSDKLAQMDRIAAKGIKEGKTPRPENKPVNPKFVVKFGHKVRKFVREGVF